MMIPHLPSSRHVLTRRGELIRRPVVGVSKRGTCRSLLRSTTICAASSKWRDEERVTNTIQRSMDNWKASLISAVFIASTVGCVIL